MKKFFRRLRIWLVVLLILLIAAAAWFVFPPYKNLQTALPEGNFTAIELFREFTSDPTGAPMKLSGKVIILEGRVAASDKDYVMLGQDMCVIKCELRKSIYDKPMQITAGDSVTLKGICRGMNRTELLVTHCILINKSPR